ncbi:dimethylsulfonioproprionate lyase family protein [Jiella mangrovi]|uniref:Cupin domain-containing protein n=1 Tax=Jiella mangrovi TaxID=2821407 RepID=A0ABS4BK47_9HYPH|nr:dimethylsulfonioproprionate lyase family protein [Jiella mangrovi]MBP0617145.1 cupin domain-containing protein [Jiella mangrovi]
MTATLSDCPNWKYLLQEFDTLYRYGSAGGSKAIRSHRKRVRDALSAIIDTNPEIVVVEPTRKPVVEHLPRALDLGARAAVSGVARALGHVAAHLAWDYGYPSVPKSLSKKYAYAEILGPKGPVRAQGLILGFVLFAPGTTYPQHAHQDIEESYVSVAGAWSENDNAVYAPGSLILNRSGVEHRITTGDLDPCLLAYAWAGPRERLAAPGMKFSARRGSARDGT